MAATAACDTCGPRATRRPWPTWSGPWSSCTRTRQRRVPVPVGACPGPHGCRPRRPPRNSSGGGGRAGLPCWLDGCGHVRARLLGGVLRAAQAMPFCTCCAAAAGVPPRRRVTPPTARAQRCVSRVAFSFTIIRQPATAGFAVYAWHAVTCHMAPRVAGIVRVKEGTAHHLMMSHACPPAMCAECSHVCGPRMAPVVRHFIARAPLICVSPSLHSTGSGCCAACSAQPSPSMRAHFLGTPISLSP